MAFEHPERWAVDLATAAVEAVREISHRDDGVADALLDVFLRTAWPSRQSQDQ